MNNNQLEVSTNVKDQSINNSSFQSIALSLDSISLFVIFITLRLSKRIKDLEKELCVMLKFARFSEVQQDQNIV